MQGEYPIILEQTAMIVVDMQNNFVQERPRSMVPRLNRLRDDRRQHKIPGIKAVLTVLARCFVLVSSIDPVIAEIEPLLAGTMAGEGLPQPAAAIGRCSLTGVRQENAACRGAAAWRGRRERASPSRVAGGECTGGAAPCGTNLERTSGKTMGEHPMPLTLRLGTPGDADRCGTISYTAFKAIAEYHRFPLDSSAPERTVANFAQRLAHLGYHVIVAELDGRIVGSNVLDERSTIVGLGPITVDPAVQNRTIGRQLMQAALQRVVERQAPGVRLVQATYHTRSLALYATLGFEVREPLVTLQGPSLAVQIPGHTARPATQADLDGCDALCRRIHGHDRHGEVREAVLQGTATVVGHEGRLTGYAAVLGYTGHAVGESNADLKALIGAAAAFVGPGFLLPTRNGELFRWCLAQGLRVVQPMTLVSLGLYNEPRGAFLPSILY